MFLKSLAVLRKRWVKARYHATLEELGERYAEWETIGEPQRREQSDPWAYFSPFRDRSQ